MYTQFGQKKLLPQVLVNLIWSFDDRNRVLFRNCIDEMKHLFFKNRLNTRISFEFEIFNTIHSQLDFRNLYKHLKYEPSFTKYILSKFKLFGDSVPNDNLPHFHFKYSNVGI